MWKPTLRFKAFLNLLVPLVLFGAMALLKIQTATDMKLNAAQSFDLGLGIGFLHDGGVVLVGFCLACLLGWLFRVRYGFFWIVTASIIWLAAFSNALYFRFFGGRLEWWVVQDHLTDIAPVEGAAISLGNQPLLIVSILLFVLSLASVWWFRSKSYQAWKIVPLLGCLLGIASGLALHQTPAWMRAPKGTALSENVLRNWYYEYSGKDSFQWMYSGPITEGQIHKPTASFYPKNYILNYKNGVYEDRPENSSVPSEKEYLIRPFEPSHQLTVQLRDELGLPKTGKLNFIVLFLESVRYFEYGAPEIGAEVFANLKQILPKHGRLYRQAYSASFNAGQTVRGQFSTLCSMLPDVLGPATYLIRPALNIECLSSFFKPHGYETVWINGFHKDFHNKQTFESLHGTELFYDMADLGKMGVNKILGWGVADDPLLDKSLDILEDIHKSGKPFFANILTLTTHFPYDKPFTEEQLSPRLSRLAQNSYEYAGYLARLKYADKAIGHFLERLFKSEMGSSTVVVMLGDHSVPIEPTLPLTAEQLTEMHFRIPFAIITKNMKKPGDYDWPVHQVDVAPTIGEISGLNGQVAWIGRNFLKGDGSPWSWMNDQGIHYRGHNKVCYQLPGDQTPRCYKVKNGQDPLYTAGLESALENPKETEFFKKLFYSVQSLILTNGIEAKTGVVGR